MSKDKIADYDGSTAGNNTDIGGISIAEGMLPSAVNNSMRELTKQLGAFSDGTDGIDVLNLHDDDASASIKIQAPSAVTTTTTLTLPDGDGDAGAMLQTNGSGQLAWSTAYRNRNLILNGAAEVYQRGAATTAHNGYAVDRWQHKGSNSTASTSSQDTDAPAPFINSIKFAAGGASSGASETAGLCQRIEGNAMTSLGWGTSAAQPATLSFYVKSSVTGTYAVSARNNGVDQSYINTYTINSANTWEYKTVTFDARTAGTWLTTNGIGMRLWFDLGSGSNFDGTAGSWTTNNHLTVSSQADVVGTSSATWFVTGVQLEIGEQATPFDHSESYGETLAKCQRYYQKSYIDGVAVGTVTQVGCNMDPVPTAGNTWRYTHNFTSHMRATPTYTFYVPDTGTSGFGGFEGAGDTNKEAIQVAFSSNKSGVYYSTSMDQTGFFMWHYELNAEL